MKTKTNYDYFGKAEKDLESACAFYSKEKPSFLKPFKTAFENILIVASFLSLILIIIAIVSGLIFLLTTIF